MPDVYDLVVTDTASALTGAGGPSTWDIVVDPDSVPDVLGGSGGVTTYDVVVSAGAQLIALDPVRGNDIFDVVVPQLTLEVPATVPVVTVFDISLIGPPGQPGSATASELPTLIDLGSPYDTLGA